MKKLFWGALLFMLFCSHDMFLKLDDYFIDPDKEEVIKLYNGTFEISENVVDRNRMLDVSLVGDGNRIAVDSSQWYEKDSITYLKFNSGKEGTWVAGVSTRPRNIALAAEEFNQYLEHDGVLDMLLWRKEHNEMKDDAVERYSKHVKTIFQVGDFLSSDWEVVLGYPLEFIPLENPYDIHPGHTLPVKLLFKGEPLKKHLVYLGNEPLQSGQSVNSHSHAGSDIHNHDHGAIGETEHHHSGINQFRTDENGIIQIPITATGVWYLRTIYMIRTQEDGLTHESNWATLTFAVGEGHSHEHAGDTHSYGNNSFPTYIYWVSSLILLAGLFFWFNQKK